MRGWFRYLAACSGAAAVLVAFPPPVEAAANAGVHLHKTVDPFQVSISPNIGVTLAVEKATAIPGCVLKTGDATAFNPWHSLAVGMGALSVGILGSVAAYYDPSLFESLALGAATGFFAGALDHYLSNSATC